MQVLKAMQQDTSQSSAFLYAQRHPVGCQILPDPAFDSSTEASRQCGTFVQEGGSKALDEWLEEEKERNMPEFKKRRPKYYYYFEWMKERISQHCGELPAPVLDKLLNIEAGELDTLLNYPKGIQAKVSFSHEGSYTLCR